MLEEQLERNDSSRGECYSTWRTHNQTEHTLHPAPCTLHPGSYTLHPTSYILNYFYFITNNTFHPFPYDLLGAIFKVPCASAAFYKASVTLQSGVFFKL